MLLVGLMQAYVVKTFAIWNVFRNYGLATQQTHSADLTRLEQSQRQGWLTVFLLSINKTTAI